MVIPSNDVDLAATLSRPAVGPIRGGLVPLHPAGDPSREQFLFRHLAALLPPHGIAVLRFDRRPNPADDDVPLGTQAADALAALHVLRATGVGDAPIGLWGFSQGAWAAPLAATLSADVAFLVLVASTGVSPAAQMRYATSEQARRAGFGPQAQAELAALRATYEAYVRGQIALPSAQAAVDRLADRPWFPLAWVPRQLSAADSWRDLDFDPGAASIAAWRRAAATAGNPDVTVVRLPGTGHHPTWRDRPDRDAISPRYTQQLLRWLAQQLAAARPSQ